MASRAASRASRRLRSISAGGASIMPLIDLTTCPETDRRDKLEPELAESLPLGATRLTRRFVRSDPVRPEELVGLRFAFDLQSSWAEAVDKLRRRELDAHVLGRRGGGRHVGPAAFDDARTSPCAGARV